MSAALAGPEAYQWCVTQSNGTIKKYEDLKTMEHSVAKRSVVDGTRPDILGVR
jgi:hypothetical protein